MKQTPSLPRMQWGGNTRIEKMDKFCTAQGREGKLKIKETMGRT